MKINPGYIESLPVASVASEVNQSLRRCPRVVVTAPPGSGKSTLLPLTILQDCPEGRVLMLEPRRAAARQIALRMAHMIGEQAGETVGYRMRFESRTSAVTRIEVVTEGVMERLLVDDPTLEGVSTVLFDEFHERSLTADLCLALTREAQDVIRPDLRIVVMSATMDTEALCRALDAPLVQAAGRMYDVRVVYGDDFDPRDCAAAVATGVRRAWREQDGNILAFLPGVGEINTCMEILAGALPEAVILPLHGMLPSAEQYRAIEYDPGAGRRKIVLATPVAETSLTIGGIRTVVDSGLYRAVKYDTSTGLSRLETERISQDMAAQRTGRAGRLCDGVCYRLWSRAADLRMAETRKPEIEDADLSSMILTVASWGGKDPMALPWLTPPQPGHVAEGQKLLLSLGAIGTDGGISPHGRRLAALPCHPRIANMLVTARDDRRRSLAADIAAILEEKDPLTDENDADINTRIAILRQQRRRGNPGRWARIAKIAGQYRRMVRASEDNDTVQPEDTGGLLVSAYPERVAMRLDDNTYRLPGGENVRLNDADDLSRCDLLAVAAMGKRVFLASPVARETLEAMAVPHENISWNSRLGRVVARKEMRLGVLVVYSKPIENPGQDVIAEIVALAAQKDGLSIFDFSDDVLRLQRRIATVAEWHPELELPDVSTDSLLAVASSWLPLYIGRAVTVQEFRKIDICDVIAGIVGYDMMSRVDRIAPTRIQLPCGRTARVDYRPGASAPVVSARLQDCLGLKDTPLLDEGRRPVLMELLSPGFKPVQLTMDLRGFWTGTYFDVRKELRRRYPKHPWPDNPLDYVPEIRK